MKIFLLILIGLFCGGCFVFDEIDQGLAIMESHTPEDQRSKVKTEGLASAEKSDGSPKSARERLNEYYAKQRAKAPVAQAAAEPDPGDKIGRCRIRGTTQYTRRSDCRLRGGTFL